MRLAVIVTTYNNSGPLKKCLDSIGQQSVIPDEVIIADDGSGFEVRSLVAESKEQFAFKLKHSWQPDRQFRAARSRNLAALLANGDVLVFVDGDCVLPIHFLRRALELFEPGYFLSGGRILLGEEDTRHFLMQASQPRIPLLQRAKLWSVPLGFMRKLQKRKVKGVKTCNLVVDSESFKIVGGFDERYVGWGLEDSDFIARLIKSGVFRKSARGYCTVVHLMHKANSRDQLSFNQSLLFEALYTDIVFSKKTVFGELF